MNHITLVFLLWNVGKDFAHSMASKSNKKVEDKTEEYKRVFSFIIQSNETWKFLFCSKVIFLLCLTLGKYNLEHNLNT